MSEVYRYRKLQQFGTLILRETSPEHLESTLFELLPEVIDIDAAALFLRSDNDRWFMKAASAGSQLLKTVRPRLRTFARKMNDEGHEPIEMASPLIIERKVNPGARGFSTVVAYPLLIMGKITAFIVAARKASRAFSTDDLNRLDHVAAILSSALENQFVVKQLRNQADDLAVEKEHLKSEVTREREFASLLRERAPYLVFVLDKKGDVIFANPFCLEVTGYSVKELKGRNFLELLHPGDSKEQRDWFKSLFTTRESQSFQTTMVARGGDHRMILWNAIKRTSARGKPIEVICIGRDVTRRAHLEAHNRVLLETLPDGMFRVNDRFEVVEVNKHAADLLGVEPQSLIGKKCYETICSETEKSCPVFGRGKDTVTFETTVPAPGDGVHVLKSIRRYELGAGQFAMETFKDITPLKRMEKKIRDYADNLERKVEQRTAELKDAQRHLIQFEKLVATGRLAASIAHEINNPIYGIRGCLQTMLDEVTLSEDMREYVELSVKETDRISDLIRRLQNFHKRSRRKRRTEDINEVLKDILVMNNKYLQENRITLQACFEPHLPKVRICEDEIKQVLINLINNAVEAMPRGGDLTIKTLRNRENVEIHFKDTGQGMPKNVRERIFDAFFTTKSAVKGVGLGLFVCWGIVQGHGGQMVVKSKPGKGTSFIMILPVDSTAAGKKEKSQGQGV